MRETSREAYQVIKAQGLLKNLEWRVYVTLHKFGPMNATECTKKMEEHFVTHNKADLKQSSSPIFARLKRKGVIIDDLPTKSCSITGMRTIVWRVTDDLPVKIKKEKSLKQKYAEALARIIDLEKQLI